MFIVLIWLLVWEIFLIMELANSGKMFSKKMLSVCFVEDLDYQVEEKIQKIKTTLTSVIERYVAGEEIRIWYSYNPDELLWYVLAYETTSTIKLPDNNLFG